MTKHSNVVGGSTAARRMNCPGSMELEAKMPDETSTFAQEGTDLHTGMEKIFTDDVQPWRLAGKPMGTIKALDGEQLDALEWCYDIVDPLIADHEFELEVTGPFPGIDNAFGTCDVVVMREDKTCVLIDYKFGRGVPVFAENNKQLMFYAACVREKHGAFATYDLHILQPRLDSHTKWMITDRELDTFVAQLQHAIKTTRDEYLIGSWCKFCKGEAICPAKTQLAQDMHAWRDLGHNSLPQALAIVDELEDWIGAVRRLAHSTLEKDVAVTGWKLVAKKTNRAWGLPDDVLRRRLSRAGLKVADYAPRKTISPAQAEKLGFVVKQDMVAVKVAGTTLARESDKREAVSKAPRDLNALADAMSSKSKNGETK